MTGAGEAGKGRTMTTEGRSPPRWFQICIGLLVLALGALVYLADRAPQATYFISRSPVGISLYQEDARLFGGIGQNFPAFAHVFAFTVISAGWLAWNRRGDLVITAGWLVVDSVFEFGQKYGTVVAQHVPGWFRGIPFLENTGHFFQKGTFDWMDLLAIVCGSMSAYIFLRVCPNRNFV